MTFLTKTNHPIVFIPTNVLVLSKRLINKKIKHYMDEVRESKDKYFIKSRRKKIAHLRCIVADLKEIIITLGS